jgi:hypothetical protein
VDIRELCLTQKNDTTNNERRRNERQIANASAKSKEVQPTAQANALHHICFCPNRTTEIELYNFDNYQIE